MRRAAATVVGVAVVLLAALTAGVVLGMVDVTPPLGDDPSVETTDGTGPELRTDGGDGGASESDAPAGGAPGSETAADGTRSPSVDAGYAMTVDRIESCGTTCRDVTATLTNTAETERQNVTVVTRVYTGDEQVWRGSQDVGTLAPGAEHTTTRRVELGYLDGLRVDRNDGYVTVETTVSSDSGTATFSERRQVT